jgi:AAA domain-containing protein
MASVYSVPQVLEHSKISEIPKRSPIVPIKLGMYGPQGSGKSTTAAMLAAALSAQFHNRAPVYVVDPEAAWSYLKPVIFDVEGIELIQRPYRSFKDMAASFREAERLGCCCWIVDPLTLLWNELMESFRLKNGGFIPIDKWGDIRSMWQDYIRHFLNSPMHAMGCGRLGNDFEEVEDERKPGKTKLTKVGTKFKAGGGESFGYEPHVLLELSLERKNKVQKGQEREGEGRMVHRADVLKDRTWALNGKIFRWSDKPRYDKGSYKQVWEAIQPHFARVQQTMMLVKIDSGTTTDVISNEGDGEFYRARQRREATSAEIKGCMDLCFGGRGKDDIKVRLAVSDIIFGVKSKEAADQLPFDQLERGLRILHAYEKIPAKNLESYETILTELTQCIGEYDRGESEEWEMPF